MSSVRLLQRADFLDTRTLICSLRLASLHSMETKGSGGDCGAAVSSQPLADGLPGTLICGELSLWKRQFRERRKPSLGHPGQTPSDEGLHTTICTGGKISRCIL